MDGLAFGWLLGSSWPVNVKNIELYISGLVVGELNNIRFFIYFIYFLCMCVLYEHKFEKLLFKIRTPKKFQPNLHIALTFMRKHYPFKC